MMAINIGIAGKSRAIKQGLVRIGELKQVPRRGRKPGAGVGAATGAHFLMWPLAVAPFLAIVAFAASREDRIETYERIIETAKRSVSVHQDQWFA